MRAPLVVGPRDVPSLRLHLIDEWMPGRPFYRVYREVGISSENVNTDPVALAAIEDLGPVHRTDASSRWERKTLSRASLWWVSPAMGDLLATALRSVPDDMYFSDLPSFDRAGLVVFAEPQQMYGSFGEHVFVDAFVFGPANLPSVFPLRPEPLLDPGGIDAVSMSFYTRVNLDEGMTPEQLQHFAPIVAESVLTGEIPKTEYGVTEDDRTAWMMHGDVWAPLGRSDWPLIDRLDHTDLLVKEGPVQASFVEDRKLLTAFITLLHQEGIAQTTTEWPHRHVVRRVQRAGLPREAASVRVVRLRELHGPEGPTGERETREWSHRWIVNGHWRNARVGRGRTQRRLVWVNPYVKGPDDKPLQTPTTVKAWVR